MAKAYLTNAFSINMLRIDRITNVQFAPVDPQELSEMLHSYGISNDGSSGYFINALGHADIAMLVGNQLLGYSLPANRINVQVFGPDEYIYIAQYHGPRLPEGTMVLPVDAEIKYYSVVLC